jgi:hypothetical protein
MGGDVHDRRFVSFIVPNNDNAELPRPTVHQTLTRSATLVVFRRELSFNQCRDFRAAIKLEHATSVPPRGERECLGDDECAAAKTEKQTHKKGPHDCCQT